MKLPFTVDQFFRHFSEIQHCRVPDTVSIHISCLCCCVSGLQTILKLESAHFVYCCRVMVLDGCSISYRFFSTINKAAYIFGSLFIIEGFLLVYFAFRKPSSFAFQLNIYGFASVLLLLYAIVIYPIIGHFSGHSYPYAPTFGLPCPTTIFTFGILLLSVHRLPWLIVIVPLLWSIIGFSAAFSLGIHEDTGLIVSGVVFTILNYTKHIYRIYTIE